MFAVTTSAVIVIFEKLFAGWPLPADAPMTARRALGASLIVLGCSAGLFVAATQFFHVELVDFMVRGPIAWIFGVFLVTDLTRSRLFLTTAQPRKGILLLLLVLILGTGMEELYRYVAPLVAGTLLPSGPPHYARDLWVATALLSLTFPLIVIVTGYFEFWPLAVGVREAEQVHGKETNPAIP